MNLRLIKHADRLKFDRAESSLRAIRFTLAKWDEGIIDEAEAFVHIHVLVAKGLGETGHEEEPK